MATVSSQPGRRTGGVLRAILVALVLGLVGGGVALTVFLHEARQGIWDRVARAVSGRELRIDLSQPTVVEQVRRLSRLESVSYTMDKMVAGDRENRVLPAFLTGDKVELEVHGEAVAGVDLGLLSRSDVWLNGKVVHIHLPPAQIFTVALDDAKTHVYARTTGILVPVDPSLEGEVREQAVENLRQSALQAGILGKAQQNACTTVTKLLLGLGFDQVECG
ncbi:MAG: DUF4230 domain-containing protein [Acidobacteriota bacterium]